MKWGNRYIARVLLAVVLSDLLLLSIIWLFQLDLKSGDGLTAFTAIPLFIITILELNRAIQIQRASFVKEYVAQFFTNHDLHLAFHELIYSYGDDKYAQIEKIAQELHLKDQKERPIFEPFAEINKDRPIGARFFHPALLQLSPEERRLDALLGYFDVVGYYYVKNILQMRDIAGTLGYQLSLMRRRRVVITYLDLTKHWWHTLPNPEELGVAPFQYLRKLLDGLAEYNKDFQKVLEKFEDNRR
jgi:hypothetical protein